MKRLIIYVIILILAVWLGLLLESDPGYVLVVYKHWTIETSLWFGIIIVLVILFILYHLFKFLYILTKSHGHIIRWYRQKRFVKAHTLTGAGLLALEEAEWEDAEALLLRGVESSTIPVVNYLNAARAAQEQLNYKRRDKYLQKASILAEDKEKRAVSLTKASLQLEHGQFNEACQLLEKLYQQEPRHPYILKLLQSAYLHLEQWDKLLELLPVLRKRKILEEDKLNELECLVYENLFKVNNKTDEKLKKLWRELPKKLRTNSRIVDVYAKRLHKKGLDSDAEAIISDAVKETFSIRLIRLYGNLHQANSKKRLQKAESWLKQYGESAVLLNTLARISLDCEQPEQAKGYVSNSLVLDESAEAYVLLAACEEKLTDNHAKDQAIDKALTLINHESNAKE